MVTVVMKEKQNERINILHFEQWRPTFFI